jgi:hypothetical protein
MRASMAPHRLQKSTLKRKKKKKKGSKKKRHKGNYN